MEWRKLKNIILLILVVLNVALAVLIGGPALSDHYRNLQGNQDAVLFLEQKGITLAELTVPDPANLPPRVVARELEEEARLAQTLLGTDAVQEARGGEVYRYTSDRGMIQFHSDGSFWAQLAQGAFPLGDDPQAAALAVLAQLDFAGEVVEQGENTITVRPIWDGAHLFNQQAAVIWDSAGINQIVADRRLYGVPTEDSSKQTITLATALVDFYNGLNQMGDVCSRVDGITPGYISTTSIRRQMELTPVWRITTDTGAYQLDLVGGGLERVA